MSRKAWPIPQMRERGLSPVWIKTHAGLPVVRLTQVCASKHTRGWKERERLSIQAALDAFDRDRESAPAGVTSGEV